MPRSRPRRRPVPPAAGAQPALLPLLREAARRAAWAGLLLAAPAPALASGPAGTSTQLTDVGDHGHVVFSFPEWPGYHYERDGDVATITFGHFAAADGTGSARNVVAVHGGEGQASITVLPGSRLEARHQGRQLVVDVFDSTARAAQRRSEERAARTASRGESARAAQAQAATPPAATPQVASSQAPTPGPTTMAAAPATAAPAPSRPATPEPAPEGAGAPHDAAAAPAQPPAPVAAAAPAPAPAPAAPPAATASAAPATVEPVAAAPLPPLRTDGAPAETLAIAAIPAPLPPGTAGSAIVLPFAAGVGAAAFRQDGTAVVVFDQERPIDLAAVGADPAFAAARITLSPGATTLSMPLAPGLALRLARRPDGWLVAAGPAAAGATIVPAVSEGTLSLPAREPGRVVVLPDPRTGGSLLVGTQRAAGGGVATRRQVPEFTLRASWQGVVVEPLSDRLELRAVPEGFRLGIPGHPLELAATEAGALALANAASLTRRFDFPDAPTPELRRRLERQVAAAADAPALGRLLPREAVAQTMISLGLAAEAQAVLALALSEAPQAANDPLLGGLGAVAALLAGRPNEAGGLAAPALSGTDEVALWRAALSATRGEALPDAAATFAAELPLVLSYPEALRARLLPLAAETMLEGGQEPAARALLARLPKEPSLALARAMALRQAGDTDGALAALDALSHDRNRLLHARATLLATELRLSAGRADAAATATALSDQAADWRGDARELRLRLRLSEVQQQAGQWRGALTTLRETEALFPEERTALHARVAELFTRLLSGDAAAGTRPLDLVALVDENVDLLPQGDAGDRLSALLAQKLEALDLPRRAEPVLSKLMAAAQPGPGRAALGRQLAEMRLEAGDPAAAQAALAASEAPALPAPLQGARTILAARARARAGDLNGATALLATLGTPEADDLRATMLADAHDWRGAEAVLTPMASALPAAGPLDAHAQDLLLRLASAADQAGDAAALARLRAQAPRVTGARGEMFRLLVAAPVRGPADLARAGRETVLAGSIPAGVSAVATH